MAGGSVGQSAGREFPQLFARLRNLTSLFTPSSRTSLGRDSLNRPQWPAYVSPLLYGYSALDRTDLLV
jgi:hypothetical protein